jgi:hypothetical protein
MTSCYWSLSRYIDWLRAGRSGHRIPVGGGGGIFRTCPDRPWGSPSQVKSSQVRLNYGRSPHAYVNQRLQIQLERLMMSGVPLETCWAFNERWNNKFYYKVASCWLFLLKQLVLIILFRQLLSWQQLLFLGNCCPDNRQSYKKNNKYQLLYT